MSGKNRFYTVRYWIRAGMKCAVSLDTSSSGDTFGIYQPELRVLWSYSERESSGTKSFECLECRYTENADINGARNIWAAGHAVLACGGIVQSGRPSKQEPSDTGLNAVGIPVSDVRMTAVNISTLLANSWLPV